MARGVYKVWLERKSSSASSVIRMEMNSASRAPSDNWWRRGSRELSRTPMALVMLFCSNVELRAVSFQLQAARGVQ